MDGPFQVDHFPLHEAVLIGNLELIHNLLSNGYDINSMHYDRVTPLHVACLKGNLSIVKYLVKFGALINAQSIDNSTPLCEACAGGDAEVVKFLLDVGAWVNPPLLHSTPLHEASLRGKTEIVSLLLSAGARVNSNDLHYGTPLHASCSMLKVDVSCIDVLLKGGASVNAIKNHRTPLHLIASNSQSLEATRKLISFGANVYLKDGNGKTPLNLCKNNSELSSFLSFCETQPRSLLFHCRLSLIKNFGPSLSEGFRLFPIPFLLTKYLD